MDTKNLDTIWEGFQDILLWQQSLTALSILMNTEGFDHLYDDSRNLVLHLYSDLMEQQTQVMEGFLEEIRKVGCGQ